jgi:hypothetical protein
MDIGMVLPLNRSGRGEFVRIARVAVAAVEVAEAAEAARAVEVESETRVIWS